MLPLSQPILSALAVFFFLVNWNAFLWPLTITTDQNLSLVQPAIAEFPKSIFRGVELYHGCIGGRRSADACPLLRVPTPVGRINQDFWPSVNQRLWKILREATTAHFLTKNSHSGNLSLDLRLS